MNIKGVLFDLDDTLYPELSYFDSGFEVLAEVLAERGIGQSSTIKELLLSIHSTEGREGVLDKASERLDFDRAWLPELISMFRRHTPKGLELWADARSTITDLRNQGYRLGCVTDGWSAVQWRKTRALELSDHLDSIVVCDDLGGRSYWKPNPTPFLACCNNISCSPNEVIFVGDNPDRDIVGASQAGLLPIRIRREESYFEGREDVGSVASISTLAELLPILKGL